MFYRFAGVLLLVLETAGFQGDSGAPRKLAQILASPGETVLLRCNLTDGRYVWMVSWYKEEQGRGLHKVARQSNKYNTTARRDSGQVNLSIFNGQRNDSGVYFCATRIQETFTVLGGTRVIISDAPSPSLSMLVPSSSEGSELHHSVPLLCLIFDAHPGTDAISWTIGGETSHEQKDVDTIDERGVFSIGSLNLVPPERWSQGVSYACSDQENRSIGAVVPVNAVSTNTGTCYSSVYFGVPCIILVFLVIPSLVLLFKKRLARGRLRNQMGTRELPQTSYAELHGRRSNAIPMDRESPAGTV